MNKYRFEITETLQKIVYIEAFDEKEANEIIMRKYNEEEIVLDSNDFFGCEITLIE